MNAFYATGRRGAAVLFLSGFALVATIATAAAVSGRGNDGPAATPSAPVVTPAPSETPDVRPVPIPGETPDETGTPAPIPSETPDETAEPAGTPEPTDGGTDAMPITVAIETTTGHDVYVDIVDYGETLVDAVSGTPGEGMSVAPYTLDVENIDERTLRLTWVDYAIDNALALYIHGEADRLVLVQPEPGHAVDSMGTDRSLILTFDRPVSADDIEASIQDGIDTPGVE